MTHSLTRALLSTGRAYVRYAPGAVGKAALVGRFLNAGLRDQPRQTVARTLYGDRFEVDTRDLIQRFIYTFGVWEPNLSHWLKQRLNPGDVFVDVGANIGYFSVLASRLVGASGKVVSVEASPEFHHKLVKQARINGCTNIRAVNTAVSDIRETLRFVLASSQNMGANSIVPFNGSIESSFDIEARPLSEVLSEQEIGRVRVIKIDVEGAEGAVVRGMKSLLDRLPETVEVAVEVTPERMAELGDSLDELLETFKSRGYNVYRLANDYDASRFQTALHRGATPPSRWRGPIVNQSDLVFSRVDAESLT